MKGCFSKTKEKYDNYCHRNHIHISLTWAGARAEVPGYPVAPVPTQPEQPAPRGTDTRATAATGGRGGRLLRHRLGARLRVIDPGRDAAERGAHRGLERCHRPGDDSAGRGHDTSGRAQGSTSHRGRYRQDQQLRSEGPQARGRTTMRVVPVSGGAVQIKAPRRPRSRCGWMSWGMRSVRSRRRPWGCHRRVCIRGACPRGEVAVVKARGVGRVPKRKRR